MPETTRSAVLAGFLFLAVSAAGQDLSVYQGKDPAALFQQSFDTESIAERVAIRSYLFRTAPASEYGCVSQAWLARYEHNYRNDKGTREILQRCTAQFPGNLVALSNLALEVTGQEKVDVLSRLLDKDAAYQDYRAIRTIYFTYLDDLKDAAAAAKFLATEEQKLPGIFVFDFIRGLDAEYNRKDLNAAHGFYQSAIAANPKFLEARERLAEVNLAEMAQRGATDQERALAPVAELIPQFVHGNDRSPELKDLIYEALIYLGGVYRKSDRFDTTSHEYFKTAYTFRPTVEAAVAAFDSTQDPDERDGLIQAASERFPYAPAILSRLGASDADPEKARAQYERAISCAVTTKDESAAAFDMAGELLEERLGEFDEAAAIYNRYRSRLPNIAEVLYPLIMNRLEAGAFAEEKKYLDEYEAALGEHNSSQAWIRARRLELEHFMANEAEAAEFYRRNPFLRSWAQQFNGSLNVELHVPRGARDIPESDLPILARVAEALKQQGAEQYIFEIEGAAAQAVADHLNKAHGVPLARLRANASGSGNRVEIRPVGNIAEPSIVATAALNSEGDLAVSPDGKYAALGSEQLELWDLEKVARLRSIGTGGYRVFSPNGHYLASVSNYTDPGGYKRFTIYVVDVNTGLFVAQIPLMGECLRVAWNPESTQIAYAAAWSNPLLVIYDIRRRRRVRTAAIPGPAEMIIKGLVWTRDGKYIVVGKAWAKELIVYEPSELRIVRRLEGIDFPHSLAEAAGGLLVCADNQRVLTVWDLATFQSRHMAITSLASEIAPHPSRPIVLLNDFGGGDDQTLEAIDLAAMKVLATRDTGGIQVEVSYTPNGNVLSAEGSGVAVLDGVTLRATGRLAGTAEPAYSGGANISNGYFLSLDANGLHVWDVSTGRKVHVWRQSFDWFAYSGIGNRFLAFRADLAAKKTYVTQLDADTLEATDWGALPIRLSCVATGGPWIAFAGVPFLPVNEASVTGTILVYHSASAKLKSSIQVPIVTGPLEYDRLYRSGFTSIDLPKSGDVVAAATFWQDGFGHRDTESQVVRMFRVSDGALERTIKRGEAVHAVAFSGEHDEFLSVTGAARTAIYESATGNWIRYTDRAFGEYRIPLAGGRELYYARNYVRSETVSRPMRGLLFAAAFEKQNLLVTLNDRNEIAFYDLKTFEPRVTIVNKKDAEWIAYAPTGEFTASLRGADKVYWFLGNRYLDFAALRERFEKPRVIEERLKGAPAAAAAPPAINPEIFAAPYRLDVVSRNNFETTAVEYELELKVFKQRADLPDPVIEFAQQGRALEAKGVQTAASATSFKRVFQLAEGLNVIQPSIRFEGASLTGPAILVTRNTPLLPPASAGKSETTLWFFGVGISKYQDADVTQLRFADRDVEAVAGLFESQKTTGLYKDVKTKLIRNEEAKAQDLRVQLQDFVGLAASQDLVVIMLSAHGIADNGDLFLLTYDADPQRPYTGLDLSEVNKILSRRPTNQKAILWIDICHAGAFGAGKESAKGRISADDAIKALSEGTGLMVLASSTAREESIESPEYGGGHGAFSAAIIEALSGHTRTEGATQDGVLWVMELQNYVSRRVPDMTKGRQHPTVPVAEKVLDFPIALMTAH